MIIKPFGFMGMGTQFDPTLGGTLTPYFWYDFTDSDTMTLSGTTITEIDSKGSNTGSLAKGTAATKYTTAYNDPVVVTVGTDTYSTFNGNPNKNSCLARKYGTGDYLTDGDFGADTANTSFFFIQPTWNMSQHVYVASWKGDSPTAGSQPEEWGMCLLADGSSSPQGGAVVYQTNSPTNTNLSVMSDSLANTFTSSYWSYDGASNVSAGNQLENYHCQVIQNTATGGTHADMVVGRNTTDVSVAFPGPKNTGGSSLYEGFAIGGRARDNVIEGALFNIRHCVIYDTTLTNTQITNVIASYKNAYPGDLLNT